MNRSVLRDTPSQTLFYRLLILGGMKHIVGNGVKKMTYCLRYIPQPHELGETDIDFIGDQLNIFLKQCGYARKNDHIFMEDVTEEEWVALADYLEELRRSKEEGGDEE